MIRRSLRSKKVDRQTAWREATNCNYGVTVTEIVLDFTPSSQSI
jgi:hypothetical protein